MAYLATTLGEIAELGRPILVLFTSISLLLQVSDLLEDNNIPHLAQHKHGQEMTLKRKFERGNAKFYSAQVYSGRALILPVRIN